LFKYKEGATASVK